MDELNILTISIRIGMAVLIGGLLGLERESKFQPAGFRTHILVCLGATMVMMTNQYIVSVYSNADPARLGAQVISGIGFLGAGTIILTRRQQVRGLTTAASLWMAGCIGIAIGIGFYEGAIISGIVIFFIMTVFQKLDRFIAVKNRYIHLYMAFGDNGFFQKFLAFCETSEIQVCNIELSKSKIPKQSGTFVILILKYPKNYTHVELMRQLSTQEGIDFIEELS